MTEIDDPPRRRNADGSLDIEAGRQRARRLRRAAPRHFWRALRRRLVPRRHG